MNAVRTQVRQKALAFEEFTVADIIRATGLNPESVRTELQRMRREGLVSSYRLDTDDRRHGGQPYLYRVTTDPTARMRLFESLEVFYPSLPEPNYPTSTQFLEAQRLLDQVEIATQGQRFKILSAAEIALDIADETEGGISAPIYVKAYLQFERARLYYLQGYYAEAKGRLEVLAGLFAGVDEEIFKRIGTLRSELGELSKAHEVYQNAIEDDSFEIRHVMSSQEHRSRQLTLLNRIGRIISSSLDSKYIPSLILQEVADILGVQDCSLLIKDNERQELVFVANTGQYELAGRRSPLDVGLAGYVIATGRSVIVNDVQQDSRFNGSVDRETGFITQSLIAVPLRSTGGFLGVIEVVNPPGSEPFNEEDQELLELAANQMVIALQHFWGSFTSVDIIGLLEQVTRPVQYQEWLPEEHHLDIFEADPFVTYHILVVDDEPAITLMLNRYLTREGYKVIIANTGTEALEIARRDLPDLILLDISLPDIDGLTVCRLLKEDERTALIPIMVVTGLDEREVRGRAHEVGADDFVQKPFEQTVLSVRVSSQLRLKRLFNQLAHTEDVIFTLAQIVETKDAATEGHQLRVSTYSEQLALAYGLRNGQVRAIRYAALLHDIGKIGVNEVILRKRGSLTSAEMAQMQQHPEIGARIVAPMRFGHEAAPIIRAHHEYWDGNGYPNGLRGEQIPIGARILALVNAFDSMTTDRPFRAARPPNEALWELREKQGLQFDPKLVDLFIDLANSGKLVSFGEAIEVGG